MAALYLPPFRIDFERRPAVEAIVPARKLALTAVAALRAGGAPGPASLALILTDDEELAELNIEHMGKPGPTDVLSFPMLPPAAFFAHAGQDPAMRAGGVADFAWPPRQRQHLGDIVISVERAIEQAEQGRGGQTLDVRWSARDELRLLVVHGVLHVCGWDHALPAERDAMRALEMKILAGR